MLELSSRYAKEADELANGTELPLLPQLESPKATSRVNATTNTERAEMFIGPHGETKVKFFFNSRFSDIKLYTLIRKRILFCRGQGSVRMGD